ncbi:DMT family transporter [Zymomonas mobilis]|uniref:DMT family transporter n=1 Tax=Zymomonas mobilis TaxID=542 RepID=UPI0039ED973B
MNEAERESQPELKLTSPKVFLPFLLVILIWSTTWIVIRDQLHSVPANWSVCYRFTIAGLMMLLFCRVKGYKLALDRSNQLFCLTVGLLLITIDYGFLYAAERHITSGLVAVVFALIIVPNSFFARVFLGKKSSPYFILGAVLAGIGLGLLFRSQLAFLPDRTEMKLGLGMSLLAVLATSLGEILLSTPRGKSKPMPVFLAWSMLWGGLGNGFVALFLDGAPVIGGGGYICSLLYLSLFGSVLAFILYFYVLHIVGPDMAAYAHVMIPIIAMAISTLCENYIWSPTAIAGSVMVLMGLFLAMKSQRKSTRSVIVEMRVD